MTLDPCKVLRGGSNFIISLDHACPDVLRYFGRRLNQSGAIVQLGHHSHEEHGITERASLQPRAEFFTIVNHANFANPIADVTSSTIGRIASTYGFPRQIQFGARVHF